MQIKVGQKVRFDPYKGLHTIGRPSYASSEVEGVIIEVFRDHSWFSVQYGEAPNTFKTSFKFHDLGQDVYFCK